MYIILAFTTGEVGIVSALSEFFIEIFSKSVALVVSITINILFAIIIIFLLKRNSRIYKDLIELMKQEIKSGGKNDER